MILIEYVTPDTAWIIDHFNVMGYYLTASIKCGDGAICRFERATVGASKS